MRRFLLLVVLALAGCARGGGTDVSAMVAPSVAVTATPSESARPTPTPSPVPPIAEMLPVELDGVELHTFATGTDIVQRLADALEMPVEAIEVRYASLHGARFVQMYAVRAPDTEGAALVEAWARVTYPSVVTDVERTEVHVGGQDVVRLHAPAVAARLGTFWVYPAGDTLLAVQAFDPAVAAEALAALP